MSQSDLDIAIVGYAGRFPGAGNVEEFWDNLCSGREAITYFSEDELAAAGIEREILRDPLYVKAAPLLDGSDTFDARLFGYSPREARTMDPQQRVLLECTWEALEHAACDPTKFGAPISVFAGAAMNTYLLFSGLLPQFQQEYLLTLISNDKDFLATRLSYKLNLRGPSVSVQSACSTSLVALHFACQSLLNGECDAAIAGAVSVRVPQRAGYLHRPGSVFSSDGHCRPFDAAATGTIFGSGAGVVVLKRLGDAQRDRDTVHALIKGTAINNDGASKVEFTAPSLHSQAEAMVEAFANANVDPTTISYVEAHGTGTQLGDPIEVAALSRAFGAATAARQFCAIGSVKANVGHLDAAAGMAGLIKTVMALERRQIPPTLHFRSPNPEIHFAETPFHVNASLTDWPTSDGPRRAAINSLGMGGTNAFAVLEEAPVREASGPSRPVQLLTLSARTLSSLDQSTIRLADYLDRNPHGNLADVAYTLHVGRRDLEYRRMLVTASPAHAAAALRAGDDPGVASRRRLPLTPDVAYLCTGQGSQYIGMGAELYQTEPSFRLAFDRCADVLRPLLGQDIRDIVFRSAPEELDRTAITQPALFTLEYALAELWQVWGVRPCALIGHSLGEYVAACLSGVFSLEDALELVTARGRLMQSLPEGSMLAVSLPEHAAVSLLRPGVWLAAVNAASMSVLSGETQTIDRLQAELEERNVTCHRLRTSHAFHSGAMDPILEAFGARVEQANPRPPGLPFVSNVTGTWITSAQACDPEYWVRQLRETTRFSDGVHTLLEGTPDRVLLEIGPGATLAALARMHPDAGANRLVLTSLPHRAGARSETENLLSSLGGLWLAGVDVNWTAFHAHEQRNRLVLPGYAFERQRYWAEPDGPAQLPVSADDAPAELPVAPPPAASDALELILQHFRRVLGLGSLSPDDNFFDMGGTSILIYEVIAAINNALKVDLSALNLLESPTAAGLAACVEQARAPVE